MLRMTKSRSRGYTSRPSIVPIMVLFWLTPGQTRARSKLRIMTRPKIFTTASYAPAIITTAIQSLCSRPRSQPTSGAVTDDISPISSQSPHDDRHSSNQHARRHVRDPPQLTRHGCLAACIQEIATSLRPGRVPPPQKLNDVPQCGDLACRGLPRKYFCAASPR